MTAGDSESGSYYAEQNVQTAVGAAMIGLSVLFVALRFYVRLRFNKAPLGWDDWLALAALVATVTAGLLVLMGMLNFERRLTRGFSRGRSMIGGAF